MWSSEYKEWTVANWGHSNGKEPSDGYSTFITTDYNGGNQLTLAHIDIYNIFLNNFFNEHEYLVKRDRDLLNLLYKLTAKNISYQIFLLENIYLKELETNDLFNYRNLLDRDMWGYVTKKGWDLKTETNGEVADAHPSITGHKNISKLFYKNLKKEWHNIK